MDLDAILYEDFGEIRAILDSLDLPGRELVELAGNVRDWCELCEDNIARYKKKGTPILIDDASKRSKVDVVADNVQFLGGGPDSPFNVWTTPWRPLWTTTACKAGRNVRRKTAFFFGPRWKRHFCWHGRLKFRCLRTLDVPVPLR